jgi:Polyketide cyclase / dehydrase and lipid transport
MGNYRFYESADLAADRVFDYLADVRNLPRYLPQLTRAEPAGGDKVRVEAQVDGRTESGEAWMRIDRERWRIEWGAEGPAEYAGKLVISDDGPERCTIELDLHTAGPDDPEVDDAVRRTVGDIITALAARTDAAQP